MKRFLAAIFFSFILLANSYAQMVQIVPEDPSQLSFVPDAFTNDPLLNLEQTFRATNHSRSTSLFVTGFLLSGLKYSSPIDDFFSYQPFDARAIDPVSFSEYSLHVNRNYQIHQSHTGIYGW
ncbi:MAG: hypothetical protein MI700_00610 [Balneolales bacterium]|nr:hypothetical protein [Balneolales bacterium]